MGWWSNLYIKYYPQMDEWIDITSELMSTAKGTSSSTQKWNYSKWSKMTELALKTACRLNKSMIRKWILSLISTPNIPLAPSLLTIESNFPTNFPTHKWSQSCKMSSNWKQQYLEDNPHPPPSTNSAISMIQPSARIISWWSPSSTA